MDDEMLPLMTSAHEAFVIASTSLAQIECMEGLLGQALAAAQKGVRPNKRWEDDALTVLRMIQQDRVERKENARR